jgi:nucleotide-binding universal stress UspA family protein
VFNRLLIPLDGSKTAEQVMPWARMCAERFRLPVELLAVVDIEAFLTSVDRARRFDKLVEASSAQSKTYLERVSGRFVGLKVKRTVAQGNAVDIIVEKAAANPSTLIAMTTHGRSGLNRWLLGSVAEKVLRATTNPVLLVRASPEGKTDGEATLRSIVTPLDGSELAEKALSVVVKIAKKLGSEIFLFRAYNIPYSLYSYGHGYYAVDIQQLMADMREDVRDYLDKKAAEVRTLGVDKVSCVAAEGLSADEIIRIGRVTPESIIAMCSHGRSGIKRWALGSVAEAVVRHSDKAVLILRPAVQ